MPRRSDASSITRPVLARSPRRWRRARPEHSRATARCPIGSPPGRIVAIRQVDPACDIKPLWSEGMRPHRTSDDLPHPDVPTTARNRLDRSWRSSSSVSRSRPKKRWSSSGSKGRSPGNGFQGLADTGGPAPSRSGHTIEKRLPGVGRDTVPLRDQRAPRACGTVPCPAFAAQSDRCRSAGPV